VARLFLYTALYVTRETDPCERETDEDGIQDGTELGYTLSDIGSDTDTNVFQPGLDPSTTSAPLDADTDDDGWQDGEDDANYNRRIDPGETNPGQSERKALPGIQLLLLGD
jgi:hypothetical protein